MSSARFFQVIRQAASDALLKDISVLEPAIDVLKAQKTTAYVLTYHASARAGS